MTVPESNASDMEVASDQRGGVAVVWVYGSLPDERDIYVQQIDSDGALAWASDGLPIAITEDREDSPLIAVDNQGI
ncbi:MAG: hypothetical protein IPP40_12095 [bacterium]|nr:hypothetical protein [bacterium]